MELENINSKIGKAIKDYWLAYAIGVAVPMYFAIYHGLSWWIALLFPFLIFGVIFAVLGGFLASLMTIAGLGSKDPWVAGICVIILMIVALLSLT